MSEEDRGLAKFIQGYYVMITKDEGFPVHVDKVISDIEVGPNEEGGTTVQVIRDEDGSYLDYFTIVTRSGVRIRVTVEVEEAGETVGEVQAEGPAGPSR